MDLLADIKEMIAQAEGKGETDEAILAAVQALVMPHDTEVVVTPGATGTTSNPDVSTGIRAEIAQNTGIIANGDVIILLNGGLGIAINLTIDSTTAPVNSGNSVVGWFVFQVPLSAGQMFSVSAGFVRAWWSSP